MDGISFSGIRKITFQTPSGTEINATTLKDVSMKLRKPDDPHGEIATDVIERKRGDSREWYSLDNEQDPKGLLNDTRNIFMFLIARSRELLFSGALGEVRKEIEAPKGHTKRKRVQRRALNRLGAELDQDQAEFIGGNLASWYLRLKPRLDAIGYTTKLDARAVRDLRLQFLEDVIKTHYDNTATKLPDRVVVVDANGNFNDKA